MRIPKTFLMILAVSIFVDFGCSNIISGFVRNYRQTGCKIENDKEPQKVNDYLKRTNLHREKKENQCQFFACVEAVKPDSNNVSGYDCRGIAYFEHLKAYSESINDLTKAIELQPTNLIFYKDRAIIHEKENQWDKALADYQKVYELSSLLEKGWIKVDIAVVYFEKNQLDLALSAINEAIAAHPDTEVLYLTRMDIYRKQGKNDLANADGQKAIELKSAKSNAKYMNKNIWTIE